MRTDLVAVLSTAVDRGDRDAIIACYAADSYDDHGALKSSGREFAEIICGPSGPGAYMTMHHLLGQSVFDVDGEQVWGRLSSSCMPYSVSGRQPVSVAISTTSGGSTASGGSCTDGWYPMPLFLATTWASIGDRAVTVPIPLQPVDSSAWRPMSASPLRGVALISTSFRWNVKPWCRSRGQTTTGDGGFHLPGGHHRVPARSAPARIADARSRRLRARERDRSQYRRRNRPPHIHFADGPQQTGPRVMPASWTESARHSGARDQTITPESYLHVAAVSRRNHLTTVTPADGRSPSGRRPVRCVDAINTFRVSAGRFAYFRVVSRSQIQRFRWSARFLCRVRFPAAPPRRPRSEKTISSLGLVVSTATSTIRAPIIGHGVAAARGCKDGTTSSAKRPTDQSLEMAFSL